MNAFDIVCVTQRAACAEDFCARLAALAAAGVDRIILREKDLTESESLKLAEHALTACGDKLTLHHFPGACSALNVPRLHVSLSQLEHAQELRQAVEVLGVSIHAPVEAVRAQELGADYVTAGHVFATDCKRGLPGRGLDFLRQTVQAVSIPVYAIGGIAAENIAAVQQTGASGVCLMSGLMRCPNPESTMQALRRAGCGVSA